MRLNAYLEAQGPGSLSKLAAWLKTPKGHLSNIASGRRECSMSLARLIRIATNGAVTPNDLADARAEYLESQSERAA